jgi:hypothetical protein
MGGQRRLPRDCSGHCDRRRSWLLSLPAEGRPRCGACRAQVSAACHQVLRLDEGKQVGVDLILMRSREAVLGARVIDFPCALDEPGRLLRRVLHGNDLVVLAAHDQRRDAFAASTPPASPANGRTRTSMCSTASVSSGASVHSLAVSCWLCHHGAVLAVDRWLCAVAALTGTRE